MSLITPQQIEKTARDIVEYWDLSDAPDNDKKKVLEMLRDYYQDKNEHIIDQYFATLTERVINRHVPETGFEQ